MCRLQWNEIFLVMPAAFSQFFKGVCDILSAKPTKTGPVPRSPINSRASSLMGLFTSSLVFCIRRVTYIPPSPYSCMFSHVSCLMSLFLSPVRQAKRKAVFKTGYWHGVFASLTSSSLDRCSFSVGMVSIRSKNPLDSP